MALWKLTCDQPRRRSADRPEFREARVFFANNVAFRRETFRRFPFPADLEGVARGACRRLWSQLNQSGIPSTGRRMPRSAIHHRMASGPLSDALSRAVGTHGSGRRPQVDRSHLKVELRSGDRSGVSRVVSDTRHGGPESTYSCGYEGDAGASCGCAGGRVSRLVSGRRDRSPDLPGADEARAQFFLRRLWRDPTSTAAGSTKCWRGPPPRSPANPSSLQWFGKTPDSICSARNSAGR